MDLCELWDADILKGIGAVASVIGSGLLAWRVSGILRALAFVAKMHDSNIVELTKISGDIVIATNSISHVERAQKLGLLVFGFILLGLGAAFQFLAIFAPT